MAQLSVSPAAVVVAVVQEIEIQEMENLRLDLQDRAVLATTQDKTELFQQAMVVVVVVVVAAKVGVMVV
jgi:hypothetical protein